MKESGLHGLHFQKGEGKVKVRSLTHTMMVHFMCQLGWATLSTTSLDVAVKVFLN